MSKKLAGAGMAIGLIAGAGAGLILEMSGSAGASSGAVTALQAAVDATTDTTAPSDSTPADPTKPAESAKPDPSTRLQEILQPLVDDGTITQAQADKVIAALAAAGPIGGRMGGPHVFKGIGRFGLDVVATALGITADDVRTALQSGQSLADLAVSKGKTAQDVIDAIVTEATTKVNERVTAGDLTQAQADKILAEATTLATDFVNNTPPAGGPGFGGPGMGRGFGRGFGGPGHRDGDNDADDTPANAPSDTTVTTVAG